MIINLLSSEIQSTSASLIVVILFFLREPSISYASKYKITNVLESIRNKNYVSVCYKEINFYSYFQRYSFGKYHRLCCILWVDNFVETRRHSNWGTK